MNGLFEFFNAFCWVIIAEAFLDKPTGECFNGTKVTVDSLRCPMLKAKIQVSRDNFAGEG